MLDKEKLEELITQAGADTYRDRLMQYAQPSIRLTLSRVDNEDEILTGAMKFGGLPDLPPDLTWPAADDIALHFLAQLRLDILSPHDPTGLLPKSGILYFFYRDNLDYEAFNPATNPELRDVMMNMAEQFLTKPPEQEDISKIQEEWMQQLADVTPSAPIHLWDLWRWSVLYFDGDLLTLKRTPAPDSLPMNLIFKPCTVTIAQDLTIPPFESYVGHKHFGFDWEFDTGQDDPFESYFELLYAIEELDDIANRMFGYPDLIQGDVFLEVESIAHAEEFSDERELYADDSIQDWVLLLQIDSDDAADFLWGDAGRLYFCIKCDDLTAKRFEKTVCAMQCS